MSVPGKRHTLKDIADRAGVAVVTVHKAIYQKPGISEATREKILRIVQEMDFSVNPVAASLKREELRIAVVYPVLSPGSNYFYAKAKEGIIEAEKQLSNYRVSLFHHPFDGSCQAQIGELEKIADLHAMDGVVTYCMDERRLNPAFEALREVGIPVVTFNADAEDSCRVAIVTAPHQRMGGLAAEFLCNIVPRSSRLLLLGTNKMMKNHQENARGFFQYARGCRPDLSITELSDPGNPRTLISELERVFSAYPEIRGVYCNSARYDLPLCKTVERLGLSGRLTVVTNDVFEALYPYLENGTVQATIWQDPQAQSRKAIELLWEYLAFKKIAASLVTVPIALVMKNNFFDFL